LANRPGDLPGLFSTPQDVERGGILAFQILVLLIGLVVGWVRKGSLWSIPGIRLRGIWLLPVPYVLQHVSIAYLTGTLYEVTIVLSYLSILLFCLVNLKVPGLLWAMGGTASNFLIMLTNGLRMPAYMPPIEQMEPKMAALLEAGRVGKSIAMSSGTHLNFLGDIFLINLRPASLVSIGDILFSIGLVVLLQHAMTMERGERRVGQA